MIKRIPIYWKEVIDKLKDIEKYLKSTYVRTQIEVNEGHCKVFDESLSAIEKLVVTLEDIQRASEQYAKECWVYCREMGCWMIREDCDQRVGDPVQIPQDARHGCAILRLSNVKFCLVKESQEAKTYGFENYGRMDTERRCVVDSNGKLLVKDVGFDTYAELDMQNRRIFNIKYENDARLGEWKVIPYHPAPPPVLLHDRLFIPTRRWRYVIEDCRYKKTKQALTALDGGEKEGK